MIAVRILLLGVLLCCGAAALGEDSVQRAIAAGAGNVDSSEKVRDAQPADPEREAMPAAPGQVVLEDKEAKQKYLDSMKRYYQYREDSFAYRSRVFEWQLFSSRLIFTVVVLLVLAGLTFAAIQFQVAMITAKRPRANAPSGERSDASPILPLATQLEISAKGIIVNSSVLGVIVLALSLGFFYLYLVYVYPIHEVI